MLFQCGVFVVLIVNVWCQKLIFYEDSMGTLDESKFSDVKDKSKIDFIDLRGNGIVRILDTALQGFENVKQLGLTLNRIECLPEDVFHDLKNVERLDLHGNKLRYLHKNTFSTLRKLVTLSLYYNLLTKLEVGLFDNTEALQELSLTHNLLTYIPAGLFTKLNNLRGLYLGPNYIHYLDRNSLPSAVPTNFKNLPLAANRLQSLDIYDSILNSLAGLSLEKNPLYCDCKLKRVYKKWRSLGGSEPICEGPEHLKRKPWSMLQESDFVCDHNAVEFNVETNKFPRIGEDVTLACHINIPVGDITITYKNGTNIVDLLRRRRRFPTILSDSSQEHSWFKLTIKDIQAHDAGSYVCVINGKAERNTYLIIDDQSHYEKCVVNVYP